MSHKPKHCLSSETATATDVDAGSTSEHNGDTQVNVSNANTNNQQHGRKEAPLMSRDHKRHIAQATTDSSSQCNQQQQHHIVTCSEMRDVWINEIGPKLDVIDIVRLSMVNQWARHIAHNIKQHNGYSTVTSVAKYREGVVCWPDLRWELALDGSSNDHTNHTADSKWCVVVSLIIGRSHVSDFSFVHPQRLEKFVFTGNGKVKFDASASDSVANMLVSSTGLVSLSLNYCIDDDDNVEWLVNVLAHHTHLSHLSLRGNYIGATRMKRLCGVLCHMSHITLLDLRGNPCGEGVKFVCDCIGNMLNINTLDLSCNNIGPNGVKYVCAALANKHQMISLNLFGNAMGSEGVSHLLPCLTQLPNLSELDVDYNGVDGETAQQVLRQLSHVQELFV